jgi:hypothetical protein
MSETDQTTEVEVSNTQNTSSQSSIIDGESLQRYVQKYVQTAIASMSGDQLQRQQEMMELQTKSQRDLEQSRKNHETAMESRRIKIDMIKVATDTLTSNAKSKPVDERDITALDIKTFADELIQYINEE